MKFYLGDLGVGVNERVRGLVGREGVGVWGGGSGVRAEENL